ncbi:alkylation response protein AidB-like acyl-CoA dehydrogenase [Bradyrhizobium sp. GM2.4]
MNFDDTLQEAEFRATARAWIAANAPKQYEEELRKSSLGRTQLKNANILEVAKAWQKKKADAGWACLHWPKEYGGRGSSPIERVIWQQEEGPFGQLSRMFIIGHGMCGPTMMAFAREEHKRAYLPPLASGEKVWCQLFSEPAGGSDVAGLRTRAEKDGDDWVINGQKIWTSGAHYSDYGILLTRTDPTVPKHKGLTMFFLDMKSPGVEVRPIKQASGASDFNEVYFTNVRIPDHQRLGEVGDGWNVSLTTLMNERSAIGAAVSTGFPELFEYCSSLMLDDGPAIEDRAVRAKLASWAAKASGTEIHQHARDLGAVEGRASGTGELHWQAGRGLHDPGCRDLCAGSARRCRCDQRCRRFRTRRPLPGDAAARAGNPCRRRH